MNLSTVDNLHDSLYSGDIKGHHSSRFLIILHLIFLCFYTNHFPRSRWDDIVETTNQSFQLLSETTWHIPGFHFVKLSRLKKVEAIQRNPPHLSVMSGVIQTNSLMTRWWRWQINLPEFSRATRNSAPVNNSAAAFLLVSGIVCQGDVHVEMMF